MSLKNIWNHMNLKRKMLSVFIPLIIIPFMLVSFFSIVISIRSGKTNAVGNASNKLSLVSSQTDQLLSNIKNNIKAFSISSSLQAAINMGYPDNAYGNYLLSSSLHASIYSVLDISQFISKGYIHTFDGRIYDVKNDNIYSPDSEMTEHYDYVTAQKGKILFSIPENASCDNFIHISKSLIDIATGKCLGIFSFDIKESLFYDSYKDVFDKATENFFITDSDGIVISSLDRESLLSPVAPDIWQCLTDNEAEATLSGKKYLVLSQNIQMGKYHAIYIMNYAKIYKEALTIALLPFSIGIIVLFAVVFFTNIFTRHLVRPIVRLAGYADEAGKGNFPHTVPVESHDEIGFLTERFFLMNQNIQKLTACIYDEQNQRREYELRLLQSQINPHFLYNCLDSISSLICDQEIDTANQMLYHLGQYYRTILSKGRNIITISEEASLIRDYLEIQAIKSPQLFTWEIKVDEAMLNLKTLKMIIQPLVENSILHGFSGYKSGRHIFIHGFLRDQNIHFEITDNGMGIPPEIQEKIFGENTTCIPRHFGLKNIQERIQLKFGKQFGITIRSLSGQGTTVTLVFPPIL